MRLVPAMVLVLFFPASASAFGLGSSIAGFGSGDDVGAGSFRPTFDLVFDPVIVQIHALDTLGAAFDDRLFLGVNVYADAYHAPIGGLFTGVIQPGGGVDLFGSPDGVSVSAQCRLGIQAEERAGFGVYVVPALGFVSGGGYTDLYTGGALQVSAWFSL